jgi:hypothetical protein
MSVTIEAKFQNIPLSELTTELGKLEAAGYGGSTVDFRTSGSGTGFQNNVIVKLFKPGRESSA